jgi:hypothetical protein
MADAEKRFEAEKKAQQLTQRDSGADSHFEAYRAKSGVWTTRRVVGPKDREAADVYRVRVKAEDEWRKSWGLHAKFRRAAGGTLLVVACVVLTVGAILAITSEPGGILIWPVTLLLAALLWFLSYKVQGDEPEKPETHRRVGQRN